MFKRIQDYLRSLVNSGTEQAMSFYEQQWHLEQQAHALTKVLLLQHRCSEAKAAWEAADAVATLHSAPEDEKIAEAYHWAESDLEYARVYLQEMIDQNRRLYGPTPEVFTRTA